MRATRFVLRTPLIRFLGKRTEVKDIDHTPRAHPQSPSGTLPTSFAEYRKNVLIHGPLGGKGNSQHSTSEYTSRNELPKRFHYPVFTEAEIDNINLGGAAIVF